VPVSKIPGTESFCFMFNGVKDLELVCCSSFVEVKTQGLFSILSDYRECGNICA
jgi:hypothetical protein